MDSDANHRDYLRALNELRSQGFEREQAEGRYWLDSRVQMWPASWGNSLEIQVFGDIEPPKAQVNFPALGITIYPERPDRAIADGALCVLKAVVSVRDRSVSSLIDATRRINVLLGAFALIEWSGCIGWWCFITHNEASPIIHSLNTARIDNEYVEGAVGAILRLPPEVRRRLDAALYWIREPRTHCGERRRIAVLRVYSGLWNALECLVEAIALVRPMPRPDKKAKQALLDEFISSRHGNLTPSDIHDCYRQIVNPGLVGRASHVIRVCFGTQADDHIDDCFHLQEKHNRLYDIRNAINHSEIDGENPEELVRVRSRLRRLELIVWGMFRYLVAFESQRVPDPRL